MAMRGMPFHANPSPLVAEGRGQYTTSMTDVQFFDQVAKADAHTLTLRKTDPESGQR